MSNDPERLKSSARSVQNALTRAGVDCEVEQLPESTRTAVEAAAAIGCTVAEIAKSIVFVSKITDRTILVIASGVNRIDEALVERHIGEKITKATAKQVREKTGFAIGGVPPVGHPNEIEILLDQDLFQLQGLWAAAGTPNAVFKISPHDLLEVTKGKTLRVTNS